MSESAYPWVSDGYSARFIRFVRVPWHAEAYRAAYLDQSGSSRNELQRLAREYITLPPRHDCSCKCPNELRGYPACVECARLRAERVKQDIPAEFGRSSVPSSVVPMTLLLDLARALAVLGPQKSASVVARWLNGPEAA